MELLSVRECPEWAGRAIAFFQKNWGTPENREMYDDCITHALDAPGLFPQWYLLADGETAVGGAALLPNDLISRMDLHPWLSALYVEPAYRGRGYSRRLIGRALRDARAAGYGALYLSTSHIGLYERMGFSYLGDGYHPDGGRSRIYSIPLDAAHMQYFR